MHKVRRDVVVSVLLVVGLLSTAVGSASAAGWLAPQNVAMSVSDLGFDEDGNAIGVGIGADSGGDPVVRAMVRPFGGQWSASVPVSASGGGDVDAPRVAVDPHGNAVAIWSVFSDEVRVASRPAGGQWSAPQVISEGGAAGEHDIVIDAQGTATAIWAEFAETASPAAYVVRSASRPNGGVWSSAVNLSAGGDGVLSQPRLAVDPQGNVTAVWRGFGPDPVVRSKSRTAAGTWSSTVSDLSSGSASVEDPQVAVDAQGTATAVWASSSGGGSGPVVQAARRVAGGAWSAAEDLGDGRAPQVAVDPQGNATAVWEWAGLTSTVVFSSSRPAAGQWSNPAPMATGDDVGKVGYPWVAADPQGNVTAVWARYDNPDTLLAQATRHVAGSSSWSPTIDLTVGYPITAIPAAGIDPQGHVSVVWSSSVDPWSGFSSVFDPIGPELRNLTVPATALVGQPVAMSVDPSDALSGVMVSWNFGDGQSASGAAVNHTYNAPDEYTVTVTGVDAMGNTTTTSEKVVIGKVIVDPAPPKPKSPDPGPGPGPAPTPKAPALSSLQQSNSRWRTHSVKRGPRLPVGTTFRFRLDRAAQVRFAFSSLVSGRRVNGRCVKVTKANRGKRRCDRSQAAGTLNIAGKAGSNSVAFTGKLSGRTLKPGRYRVLVTARADGKTSSARSITFTIVR
jgi:hypothetical protein